MGVLAVGCLVIGLVPVLIVPALDRVIEGWAVTAAGVGVTSVAGMAPLTGLSAIGVAMLAATGGLVVLVKRGMRSGGVVPASTWGCGFVRPTPRIQYTGSSFVQFLVHSLQRVLRPRSERPNLPQVFCAPSRFAT
jgi:hydrogenase-4 component B